MFQSSVAAVRVATTTFAARCFSRILPSSTSSIATLSRAAAPSFSPLTKTPAFAQTRQIATTTPRHQPDQGPGVHQNPLVGKLWQVRKTLKEAAACDDAVAAASAVEPLAKAPSESRTAVIYEFGTMGDLADQYRNPWNHIQVGRVLEDLDALAGTIAFDHSMPAALTMHIVTATVDEVKITGERPSLEKDLHMAGSVVWVGRSSMAIEMRAWQTSEDEPWLQATFTFVGRSFETGKAVAINPLLPETAQEKALFTHAANQADVKKAFRRLKAGKCTSVERNNQLEQVTNDLLEQGSQALNLPALVDPNYVFAYQTRATNLFLCNPQQRNTAGRIFGGFLMRRAFELAHATAYRFCGQPPSIVEVDEVNFKAPVSIGDLLKIESHVLYTEVKDGCRQIHVEAIAHITDPKELKDTISNEFQFTFEIQGETPPLRRMLPATPSLARRMAERILAESGTWQDPEHAQATQQQQQQKATATVYDGPPGKEGSAGDMY